MSIFGVTIISRVTPPDEAIAKARTSIRSKKRQQIREEAKLREEKAAAQKAALRCLEKGNHEEARRKAEAIVELNRSIKQNSQMEKQLTSANNNLTTVQKGIDQAETFDAISGAIVSLSHVPVMKDLPKKAMASQAAQMKITTSIETMQGILNDFEVDEEELEENEKEVSSTKSKEAQRIFAELQEEHALSRGEKMNTIPFSQIPSALPPVRIVSEDAEKIDVGALQSRFDELNK